MRDWRYEGFEEDGFALDPWASGYDPLDLEDVIQVTARARR